MTIKSQPFIQKKLSFSSRLSLAFLFLSFTYLVTNSPLPHPSFSSVSDVAQLGATLGKGVDNVASGGTDAAKLTKNLGSVKATSGIDEAADLRNVDSGISTGTDASKLSDLRKTNLGDTSKFPDANAQRTTTLPETPQQTGKISDDLGDTTRSPDANLQRTTTLPENPQQMGKISDDLGDSTSLPDVKVQKTETLPGTPQQTAKIVDNLELDTVKLVNDAAKRSRGYNTFWFIRKVRDVPGIQTVIEKVYMAPRKMRMALNALKIDRGLKQAVVLQISGDNAGALKQLNRVEAIIEKNRILRLKWADQIGKPYNIKHGSRFRYYKYIKAFGMRGKEYDNIVNGIEKDPLKIADVAKRIQIKAASKDAKALKAFQLKEARRLKITAYKEAHPRITKFLNWNSRQWKALNDKMDFAAGKYRVSETPTNPSTAANIGEQTQNVGADAAQVRTASDVAHGTQVSPGVTKTQSTQ